MDSKRGAMEGTSQNQSASDLNILLKNIEQALSNSKSDHEFQKLSWVRDMISSKLIDDSTAKCFEKINH